MTLVFDHDEKYGTLSCLMGKRTLLRSEIASINQQIQTTVPPGSKVDNNLMIWYRGAVDAREIKERQLAEMQERIKALINEIRVGHERTKYRQARQFVRAAEAVLNREEIDRLWGIARSKTLGIA